MRTSPALTLLRGLALLLSLSTLPQCLDALAIPSPQLAARPTQNLPGGAAPTTSGLHGAEKTAEPAGGANGGGVAGKKTMYGKLFAQAAPMLWPEERPLQLRVFLCITLIAISRVANLLLPFTYKVAVDVLGAYLAEKRQGGGNEGVSPVDEAAREQMRAEGPEGVAWRKVAKLVCGYIAIKGYLALQSDVRNLVFTPVSQSTRARVQLRVLDHLHSLSHRYHLGRKTGNILQVVERGTNSLQSLLSLSAFHVLPSLLDMIVCIALFSYKKQYRLAAVTSTTIVVYLTITSVVTEWRTKFRKAMITAENKAKQRAVESLTNFETVKVCGAEKFEQEMYGKALSSQHESELASERSLFSLNSLQQVVVCSGLLASMLHAANSVLRAEMSIGDFVLVNTYFLQLYQPLNWIGTIYRVIQQNFIEMESLFDLLDTPIEVSDAPGAPPLMISSARIDFENVSFAYEKRADARLILDQVSFSVLPGETVAFVGESGSGKTTVGRLLLRLYDPTGGRVLIDGQDVREVTQSSLRKHIGVVPQETVLFHDSVEYNIGYGAADATRDEIEAAARAAQIHDRIMSFEHGYETEVGERGLRLSGGEKQRVAIARVMLRAPELLLLDEATSALDSATEKEVQNALFDACKGRTAVVVSHRLSSIVNADRIIVLRNGSIAQEGSHEELIADEEGEYAGLWRAQDAGTRSALRRDLSNSDLSALDPLAPPPPPPSPAPSLPRTRSGSISRAPSGSLRGGGDENVLRSDPSEPSLSSV